MYFFQEPLIQYFIQVFKATDFTDPAVGDDFFRLITPGNTIEFPDRPFERFNDYENLLRRLLGADPDKYRVMHKGTPFGFMSWLAFDLGNYEKGLFYLDAGISEDVRKANPPETWIENPGPKVLTLNVNPNNIWFRRTVDEVKRLLDQELIRFNRISNQPPLNLASWQGFVTKLIQNPANRTIVSALYVFLLEFNHHQQELELRQGSTGGSNQPFTVHLFTGGLLFESLLKLCYRTDDQGKNNQTVDDVLSTKSFQSDFGLTTALKTNARTLSAIHAAIQGSASVETAFSTSGKLRNTTGHNLVWDDIFSGPTKYTDLFEQVMNALLYVISRKLL